MDGNVGNELEALLQCTADMIAHIAASDLITFTAALLTLGLIAFGVKSEVDALGTPQAKANKIVEAVTLKVKAQASNFQKFVAVLKENGLSDLAAILQGKLSK